MFHQPKTISEFKTLSTGLSQYYVILHKDWDILSNLIKEFVEDKFTQSGLTFFMLDIFEEPEFFTMFNTTNVPSLIIVNGTETRDQTIPAMIWRTLESLARQN